METAVLPGNIFEEFEDVFAAKRCCYDLSFGFEFSGEFGVLADFIPVSYTHLTLPTICSV